MKRSSADYEMLTRLLDAALELDESARADWLAALPRDCQSQRPALTRMFTLDRAKSNRTLKALEFRLRSSARGVRALCEQASGAG